MTSLNLQPLYAKTLATPAFPEKVLEPNPKPISPIADPVPELASGALMLYSSAVI